MKKKFKGMIFVLLLALLPAALVGGKYIASADSITDKNSLDIQSKSAYLIDYNSGTVLYEKNANERRPIASMVKIMTLLLSFEEVEKGNMTFSDVVQISENAAGMGGSQAFLDANSGYTIDTLIKTITIASANDSCVAMAEHISGSVETFVSHMNEKAAALGMKDTNFVNCTGLPAANQYSCAHDVAIMTKALLKHKDYYRYSTIWMDNLAHPSGRVTELTNTNKMIRFYEGCDGGKTGFTNEAMFCLSATAKKGDMRLISIIIGGPDSKIRFAENSKLLNYGFANFENKLVVSSGKESTQKAAVSRGKEKELSAIAKEDFFIFGEKNQKGKINLTEEFFELKAPVKQNQVIGKIIIEKEGTKIGEVELLAKDEIKKISYNDRVMDIIHNLAS